MGETPEVRQLTAYALDEPTVAMTWSSQSARTWLQTDTSAAAYHDDDVFLDRERPGVER